MEPVRWVTIALLVYVEKVRTQFLSLPSKSLKLNEKIGAPPTLRLRNRYNRHGTSHMRKRSLHGITDAFSPDQFCSPQCRKMLRSDGGTTRNSQQRWQPIAECVRVKIIVFLQQVL